MLQVILEPQEQPVQQVIQDLLVHKVFKVLPVQLVIQEPLVLQDQLVQQVQIQQCQVQLAQQERQE